MWSLRQVYGELSGECGVSVPFSQLLEEVETEAQQQSPEPPGAELHLALSQTQVESAADGEQQDEPPAADKRYAGMTMSRLVIEDDSQLSEDGSRKNVTAAEETQINGGSPSPQRSSHDRYHSSATLILTAIVIDVAMVIVIVLKLLLTIMCLASHVMNACVFRGHYAQ